MCGTGGIIGSGEDRDIIYHGLKVLLKLQNRGQDAAGYATIDHDGLDHIIKGEGLVRNIFNPENIRKLQGPVGVWATRYRTMGGLGTINAQPHHANTNNDRFTIDCSQNGNIVNHAPLRNELERRGYYFKSENDTEVIAKTIAYYLDKQKETPGIQAIVAACTKTIESLVGAYTVVVALYDRATKDHYLVAFSDPRKIRPGVVGKKDGMYAVASESNALELNGFHGIRDLLPGEIFIVRRSDMKTHSEIAKQKKRAHCMFEYVYMGHPNSVNWGMENNDARFHLGKKLAEENPDLRESTDIVMPLPSTAIPIADGFAETIQRPIRHGIIKDRYGDGRIFLMPDHDTRIKAAEENTEIVVSVVYGRRVTVADDSIVKMNQTPDLLRKLEKAGATAANLAIACPRIINTCNKGIYMPKHSELGAYNKEIFKERIGKEPPTAEELQKHLRSIKEIEAVLQKEVKIPVTLRYLSIEGLLSVLEDGDKKNLVPRVNDGHFDKNILEKTRTRNDLCLACITHDDPIANDTGGLVE